MTNKLIRDKKTAEDLIGKTVEIINTIGNHLVPIGTRVVITGTYHNGDYKFYHDYNSTSLKGTNFKKLPLTLKELRSELKRITEEYEKESKQIKDKITFIKEIGSEEFDENEFKAYTTLSIIEGTTSKKEKAKLIANLLK